MTLHEKSPAVQRTEPVLIGPVCTGKSSVARCLAEAYGLERHDLDTVMNEYFGRSPCFDADTYNTLMDRDGAAAAYEYSGDALVWSLRQYLSDNSGGVFDIGAGYTSHRRQELNVQTRAALGQFRDVVLLMPDRDPERSLDILRTRLGEVRGHSWTLDGFDYLRFWVTSGHYEALASLVVYSDSRTPEAVAEEIAASLSLGVA